MATVFEKSSFKHIRATRTWRRVGGSFRELDANLSHVFMGLFELSGWFRYQDVLKFSKMQHVSKKTYIKIYDLILEPDLLEMCFVSSLHQIHLEHLRQSANPKEISTGALDVAMFTLCKTKSLFPRQIWVGKIFRFSSKTIFVHVENCHASLCWSLYRQTDMLMQLTCLAVFTARIGEASEGESPGSAVALWNCGVSGNLWSVYR